MNDYIIRVRNPDGTVERFSLSHRSKVYSKRKELGLPVFDSETVQHQYVGKQFLVKDEVVTITKVVKQWHAGFYYAALYVNEKESHGFVYIENINSIDPCVLNSIQCFKEEFKLLKEEIKMKLDLTSVQQLLKDKKEASYEFENGDVLLIAEKDGDFSGIGELTYITVAYGSLEKYDGEVCYMLTNSQFFSLNNKEEAIQCFLGRLNSDDPVAYFGNQYSLQEVKERS